MKILKDSGLEEVDEIKDVETSPKEPELQKPNSETQKLNPEQRVKYKEKCNDDPRFKGNGLIAIGKGTYYILIILAIVSVATLLANTIWNNLIFSGKEYAGNTSIVNNIEPNPVNIANEYTIENNVSITNEYTFTEGFINALKEILNITT